MPTKERTKENCRCFDAADPRPRGCTPLGTPKRRSEGAWAKRKQYYFSFLTPPPLPPPLSRVFPRTPAGGRGRPPCQRGLSPLGDWGIPTGYALQPVPGQRFHYPERCPINRTPKRPKNRLVRHCGQNAHNSSKNMCNFLNKTPLRKGVFFGTIKLCKSVCLELCPEQEWGMCQMTQDLCGPDNRTAL